MCIRDSACVAQAGDDVAVLVQVVILCAEVDVHIGMCLVQGLDVYKRQGETSLGHLAARRTVVSISSAMP